MMKNFYYTSQKYEVKINNSNVIYLNSIKELKKLNKKDEINTIVNFASSINSKNNLYNTFFVILFLSFKNLFCFKNLI